ncbi:MAG: ASCH domain-containing protein [Ruminococcus sp.]|nr:ASCH domain-containing protein [Ruminococcus sp.]
MLHNMKLNASPFEKIKNGTKTIELRLNDEKRQQVKTGDFIEFSCIGNPSDKIQTKVTALHYFESFEELYNSLPLIQCGYTEETVKNACFSDMEKFYSKEEQEKYGVVGIELEITDLNIE